MGCRIFDGTTVISVLKIEISESAVAFAMELIF